MDLLKHAKYRVACVKSILSAKIISSSSTLFRRKKWGRVDKNRAIAC